MQAIIFEVAEASTCSSRSNQLINSVPLIRLVGLDPRAFSSVLHSFFRADSLGVSSSCMSRNSQNLPCSKARVRAYSDSFANAAAVSPTVRSDGGGVVERGEPGLSGF